MSTRSLREAWKAAVYPDLLPALDKGLRASTGVRAFPFRSIGRLIESVHWWQPPTKRLGASPNNTKVPQGPSGGWNGEVQGIAYDQDYMYLVSTDALWAVRRHEEAPAKDIPIGQLSIIDTDGLHYVGRQHLREDDLKRETGPKHLSPPSLYQGRLIVPAEGGLSGDGQQWLWVFDTATLGYLGRIGLDAVESGLNDEISWCSADEDSGLLYASRYTEPSSVAVFRLPALSGLTSRPAEVPAVDAAGSDPPLAAKYVGGITLRGFQREEEKLSKVQGGVVTSNGRLYITCMEAKGEKAYGILGYDLLTGLAVRWQSLGFVEEFFPSGPLLQGITVFDDQLHVLVWDPNISANTYSVFSFALNQPGEKW